MDEDATEVPLPGGDVTEGVVRVGDTVRRPAGLRSPRVRLVLEHLASVGFTGCPRWLGSDARGRDVLSFASGEVAGRPWPEWLADDERIASVARLVRAYDDAVAPLGLPALVAAYGLDPEDRSRVVPLARATTVRSWFAMRARAEHLGGGWARMWDEGVGDQILRRQQWLAEHSGDVDDALTARP